MIYRLVMHGIHGLKEERVNENQDRNCGGSSILQLEPGSLSTKGDLLAIGRGMGNPGLGIPV